MSEPYSGRVVVYGEPAGMGSKRIGRSKAGAPIILDAKDGKLRAWQDTLCRAFLQCRPEQPLNAAVGVRVRIYAARPAGHYGKRGLLPSAPVFPERGRFHDADKVCRSIGDSLTAVGVVVDDKRVCDWDVSRRWDDGEGERVEVTVWELRDPQDLVRR